MSLQEIVSMNVRIFMLMRKTSQGELAKALGISQPSISLKLRNSSAWLLEDIEKTARYFNVAPEKLVGLQGLEPWTERL